MSAQALEELKSLTVTLQTLSAGNPRNAPDNSLPMRQQPDAILTSTLIDPKNTWKEYLLIQKLNDAAIVPVKNNELDAGYDLYAFDACLIPAWGKGIVSTQISIGLPPGTYGRVASRSGMSVNNDIEVGAGVIDRGYTGELKVVLRNFSDKPYQVNRGDKVAQLILEQHRSCQTKVIRNIQEVIGRTSRGATGFGSSGK